ncbi:MAG: sorbosone dehydrogenase family protein [Ilumatobacter sp.]
MGRFRAAAGAAAACGLLLAGCGVDTPSSGAALGPLAFTQRARLVSVDFVEFVDADVKLVTIVERPGDEHLYGIDKLGRVVRIERPTLNDVDSSGRLTAEWRTVESLDDVVLDVSANTLAIAEEGLIGLAFDPTGNLAYIHHSRVGDGHSVIAEYSVAPDGLFDAGSRRELFVVEQFDVFHNAGQLLFGPDGYLYVAMGDGSPFVDLERKALDVTSPLGKILRIDPTPSGEAEYSVPDDNPLVQFAAADPRIWSWGLRNPFSFSFDSHTGDLWIADVGQEGSEEINFAPAIDGRDAGRGRNFGWSAFEGFERYNLDQPERDHTPPRLVYSRDDDGGCAAVSDGLVVRDSAVSSLDGWYTYGDWCSGLVWAHDLLQPTADSVVLGQMTGFTQMLQTEDGNLYVSSQLGKVALVVSN